jgi:hypothetical protein
VYAEAGLIHLSFAGPLGVGAVCRRRCAGGNAECVLMQCRRAIGPGDVDDGNA